MKKKLLSIVLCLCMVLTLLPTVTIPALAVDDSVYAYVGTAGLTVSKPYTTDGSTASVDPGVGNRAESYALLDFNDNDTIITLHNFTYSGNGYTNVDTSTVNAGVIETLGSFSYIVLEGENNITSNTTPFGIYGESNLYIEGSGSLNVIGGTSICTYSDGMNSNGGICADNIYIHGDVTIAASCNAAESATAAKRYGIGGTYGGFEIYENATVTATGGPVSGDDAISCGTYGWTSKVYDNATVTATGGKTSGANGSSYGIDGNEIDISGNAVVNATGGTATDSSYGICSTSSGTDTSTVTVSGGTVNATGGAASSATGISYGIYAKTSAAFTGGVTVARAGMTGTTPSYTGTNRYGVYCATSSGISLTGTKIAGAVGYEDTTFGALSTYVTTGNTITGTRTNPDKTATGVVIVPSTYAKQVYSGTPSDSLTISQDTYVVTEEKAALTMAADKTLSVDSGKTLVAVSLIESTGSVETDGVRGVGDMTLSGAGSIIAVGGNMSSNVFGEIQSVGAGSTGGKVNISENIKLIALGGYVSNSASSNIIGSIGLSSSDCICISDNPVVTAIGGCVNNSNGGGTSSYGSCGSAEISGGSITAIGGSVSGGASAMLYSSGFARAAEISGGTGTAISGTGSGGFDQTIQAMNVTPTFSNGMGFTSGAYDSKLASWALIPVDLFSAKYYKNQLWDCQRSPAFPVAGRSIRISGLKAPYDQNMSKISFADETNDYVTFEYVSPVSTLSEAVQNRIINSVKWYTGATAEQIKAAAVVKEVLHTETGQSETVVLSRIGLVWALDEEGFLYTAMDGAYKYSGGVGTFVGSKAHNSGDTIIYETEKTEPLPYEVIVNDPVFPPSGDPSTPAVKYQELIRVIDGSDAPVSGATVKITVNSTDYTGTTDTNGYVQFTGLPVQAVSQATVKSGSYATSTYSTVDSPEAVLVYTNPSSDGSGTQQAKVAVTVNITTTGGGTGGTVKYLGATTSSTSPYSIVKGDTALFSITPASGYKVTAATWGGTNNVLTDAKTGYFKVGNVTDSMTFAVTFTAITEKPFYEIKYSTAQLFDVQRSPAFPNSGNSSIRFSWLAQPYDSSLQKITLADGEYIKFDKVKSVNDAGLTSNYTNSLKYWSDAVQIGSAALVKENVYNSSNVLVRTLGIGLIWCHDDPDSKGFLFTALDGTYGSSGGIGTYVSFDALRYGSSVSQITKSAEPLQWGNVGNLKGKSDPVLPDNQDVTFDFAGLVLKESDKSAVSGATGTLKWCGEDYTVIANTNGRFVVPDLPYVENGAYSAVISGKNFTGTLPALNGVGNDAASHQGGSTPSEVIFLMPSGASTQGSIATPRTVTVTKTGSGSVSPLGTVKVNDGDSLRVVFTADSGNSLSEVKVDGTPDVTAKTNGYYKFTGVGGDHTLAVTFVSNGGGIGGGGGSTPTTGKADPILVDDVPYDIGKQTESENKTTVTADQEKLKTYIDSGTDSVTVPVSDKTATAVAQLVVENIEDMAKKEMTLNVQTGGVTYQLPTTAMDTESAMKALGATNSTEVPVHVTITKLEEGSVTTDKGAAVLNPVEFTVTATYGGKTVELKRFSKYVQRTIALPEGYNSGKITTAIRVEDGEHVPTEVYQKDGKPCATINSLTNSTYILIYNEQSFADASGRWYEAAAGEMASRCIVLGRTDGSFDGEASVTRAEFATMVVRALGLPETGSSSFSDVSANNWFAGAVGAAVEYGIVNGYTDGTFAPNASITRQEAMAMVQRAAEVAEFAGTASSLAAFPDADEVSPWAKDAVAFNVGSGLIIGSDGKLIVKAPITRAQTAVVILRLLQKSELVDIRTQA